VATDGPRRRSSQNVGAGNNETMAQNERMESIESEGSGGSQMMTERCVLVARLMGKKNIKYNLEKEFNLFFLNS